MNLKNFFLKHCEDKNYEINQNQLVIIDNLNNFYLDNFYQSFLVKIFKKKEKVGILPCRGCRSWKNNDFKIFL